MQPQLRSRHVRGPQAAVITYLLQEGWEPEGPADWRVQPDGTGMQHNWQFNPAALTGYEKVDVPKAFLQEYEGA
eukprot:7139624-Pyramimonas_sp.AAC.1